MPAAGVVTLHSTPVEQARYEHAPSVLDLLGKYQSREAGGIARGTGRPESVVNVPHHDVAFDVVAGQPDEPPAVEYRLPDSGHVVFEAQVERASDLMVGDEIDPESNEIELVAVGHEKRVCRRRHKRKELSV